MGLRRQWLTVDPELGEATVFSGRFDLLLVVAALIAVVVILCWPSLIKLVLWLAIGSFPLGSALAMWRTRLVVADLGLRYVRPWDHDRVVRWEAVASIAIEGDLWRAKHVAISYVDGARASTLRVNDLAAKLETVRAVADERRAARLE